MERELVELVGGYAEKSSHLVDESARTSRAGAVHTLFNSACEEDYLSVLAAELDNSVSVGLFFLYGEKCRVYLLHEGYLRRIGKSETCRARDADLEFLVGVVRLYQLELVGNGLLDLGKVALIL